jgi:hypothetical protein
MLFVHEREDRFAAERTIARFGHFPDITHAQALVD